MWVSMIPRLGPYNPLLGKGMLQVSPYMLDIFVAKYWQQFLGDVEVRKERFKTELKHDLELQVILPPASGGLARIAHY